MEFMLFDQAAYDATLVKWSSEALEYDCFPNEVQTRLAIVQQSLQAKSNTTGNVPMAYGVFAPGQNVASCVCDLVLSDRGTFGGKWLKMLKVTLSPEIDAKLQEGDPEATLAAIRSYKVATLGAFSARLDHEADTLKLYGRSREHLNFLLAMLSALNENSATVRATREGRWLVLRGKQG
jgi:hypothetical protein